MNTNKAALLEQHLSCIAMLNTAYAGADDENRLAHKADIYDYIINSISMLMTGDEPIDDESIQKVG